MHLFPFKYDRLIKQTLKRTNESPLRTQKPEAWEAKRRERDHQEDLLIVASTTSARATSRRKCPSRIIPPHHLPESQLFGALAPRGGIHHLAAPLCRHALVMRATTLLHIVMLGIRGPRSYLLVKDMNKLLGARRREDPSGRPQPWLLIHLLHHALFCHIAHLTEAPSPDGSRQIQFKSSRFPQPEDPPLIKLCVEMVVTHGSSSRVERPLSFCLPLFLEVDCSCPSIPRWWERVEVMPGWGEERRQWRQRQPIQGEERNGEEKWRSRRRRDPARGRELVEWGGSVWQVYMFVEFFLSS